MPPTLIISFLHCCYSNYQFCMRPHTSVYVYTCAVIVVPTVLSFFFLNFWVCLFIVSSPFAQVYGSTTGGNIKVVACIEDHKFSPRNYWWAGLPFSPSSYFPLSAPLLSLISPLLLLCIGMVDGDQSGLSHFPLEAPVISVVLSKSRWARHKLHIRLHYSVHCISYYCRCITMKMAMCS